MKSDFSALQVYCSTEDHIRAHFLICYVALFIMRLMELDIRGKYSASAISSVLREVVGHKLKANYYLFDHYSDVIDSLCNKIGIDLNKETMSKGQIRKIMAEVKSS